MLKEDEKALLQRVIGMVQHGGKEIYEAVTLVMVGTNDRARRTYLRNILTQAAREKIRRMQRKIAA